MMQQASDSYLAEVREKWKRKSQSMLERDGRNPRFLYGGHDLKNNPALSTTMLKIGEGYITYCARKFELYDQEFPSAAEGATGGKRADRVQIKRSWKPLIKKS